MRKARGVESSVSMLMAVDQWDGILDMTMILVCLYIAKNIYCYLKSLFAISMSSTDHNAVAISCRNHLVMPSSKVYIFFTFSLSIIELPFEEATVWYVATGVGRWSANIELLAQIHLKKYGVNPLLLVFIALCLFLVVVCLPWPSRGNSFPFAWKLAMHAVESSWTLV